MAKKIGAYARLLRLSNAPTAVADVWMGYAVVMGTLSPSLPILLACFASLFFYHGGMVLNDAFDAERDQKDARGRAIEQGIISKNAALAFGAVLIMAGIVALHAVRAMSGNPWVAMLAMLLAFFVLAYNVFKRTGGGPVLMGACRSLNVLIGAAAVPEVTIETVAYPYAVGWAALGNGVYVTGVTLFARDESHGGMRRQLAFGLLTALFGVVVHAIGLWMRERSASLVAVPTWLLLWTVTCLFALRGMVAAIIQPTPRNIGRGVGIAIQGIIVIDATLAAVYAGPMAGLAIFALLPVTMLLSRWIPQT